MIAGLGGLYYVMDYACGVWSNNAFGDRGWLAIALVIFTIWRPNVSVLASILFGGSQASGWPIWGVSRPCGRQPVTSGQNVPKLYTKASGSSRSS